jgi:NAD(P)-dependent dehydrogenase (short-subunit alcohol dehydrogenase family)
MSILNKFELTGKKAIVTGGAQGIGQVVSFALAEAGADVAIFDLKNAAETIELINKTGRESFWLEVDVSSPEQVSSAFAKVEDKFKKIDIVFNNAGISIWSAAEEMSFETWRKVLSVNLDACFLVAQAAAKSMIKNGVHGSIINTASMSAGIVNYPQLQVNYNASKAGVVHMTHTMACEWAKYHIRINCISPGYVATPLSLRENPDMKKIWVDLIPMKRMCEPEELCGAVVFLASSASTYMTGSNVVIDGGYSCY